MVSSVMNEVALPRDTYIKWAIICLEYGLLPSHIQAIILPNEESKCSWNYILQGHCHAGLENTIEVSANIHI